MQDDRQPVVQRVPLMSERGNALRRCGPSGKKDVAGHHEHSVSHGDLRSKMYARGTFTDSLTTYFQRSSRFDAMGLVGVGDVYGSSPCRLARIDSRNM